MPRLVAPGVTRSPPPDVALHGNLLPRGNPRV